MDYGKGTGTVNAASASFRTYVKGALEILLKNVRGKDPTGAGLVQIRERGWMGTQKREDRLYYFIYSAGFQE